MCSRQIFYSVERLTVITSGVVECLPNYDAAAAKHYLCHLTLFPVHNQPTKTKFFKIQKPLSGHVSHMFTELRKWVLPTCWKVLGVDGDNIDQEVAETWLDKDEFMLSTKGQQADGAAAMAFFRHTGAHNRIIKLAGAGGVEHVSMTAGHVMMLGSFAWHELMVAAGLFQRHRQGSFDCTFKWSCEEAGPVRTIVPISASVFNGISIADYSDPRRFDMVLNPACQLSGSGSSTGGAPTSTATVECVGSEANRVDGGEATAGAALGVSEGQAPAKPAVAAFVDGLDTDGDANLDPSPTAAAVRHGQEGDGEGAADDEEHGGDIGTDGETGADGCRTQMRPKVVGRAGKRAMTRMTSHSTRRTSFFEAGRVAVGLVEMVALFDRDVVQKLFIVRGHPRVL